MAKQKKVTVLGRVSKIVTDRTRFKMYSPEIQFENLFITFEVPAGEAVSKDDGTVIVTLDGFAMHILDTFATSLETIHSQWERRQAQADEKTQKNSMQKSRKKTKK